MATIGDRNDGCYVGGHSFSLVEKLPGKLLLPRPSAGRPRLMFQSVGPNHFVNGRTTTIRNYWSYSGSLGLLKRTVNLMLPCPNCGKFGALRFPGSRFDAVSSGGKRIRERRKLIRSSCCSADRLAKASRAA